MGKLTTHERLRTQTTILDSNFPCRNRDFFWRRFFLGPTLETGYRQSNRPNQQRKRQTGTSKLRNLLENLERSERKIRRVRYKHQRPGQSLGGNRRSGGVTQRPLHRFLPAGK